MYQVPSVAIIAGTLAITVRNPLNAPARTPISSEPAIATGRLTPATHSFASTTLVRAMTPAGDKSIPPEIIKSVAALAIIIKVDSCLIIFIKFLAFRYLSLTHDSTTIIVSKINNVAILCIVLVLNLTCFICFYPHCI